VPSAGSSTPAFVKSAELYDAIYHFKDYARECERLRSLIREFVQGARTVLDVACGTGEHAKFLKSNYMVDGIDINEDYLRAARRKNPAGNYICAEMTEFTLGRTYDVVTCLFSAIGYVKTVARLEQAIARMARHVSPGGVLLVEPWFAPDEWQSGTQFIHAGQIGNDKVCRMSLSLREDNRSVILLHYLRATSNGIKHYRERLELGMFTRDEMRHAFETAHMEVRHDPKGLMGRGLYIGISAA
jgi:ubiquinone/menaquinone biosynthesis C-methylase UbiE